MKKGVFMKNLVLALAMVAASAITSQAHASLAAPLWACKLKANIVNTQSSFELLVIRGETVSGSGKVVCQDALGQKTSHNVSIQIQSGGIGPAFNGPLEGLTIYAVRAGVSSTDGMIGSFQLAAGPRLGLISSRAGLMAGVQIAGNSVGAGIEAVIENRFSVGVDLGGMVMTVTPAQRLRH